MKEKYALALMDMTCRFGETSEAQRLKVGAMIYKNGAVISLGTNGQPPGWVSEKCEDAHGKTLETVRHAEIAALDKLYLSTETSEGAYMLISHSPCLMCSLKIVAAKIKRVYYRTTYRDTSGLDYLECCGVEVIKIGEQHGN